MAHHSSIHLAHLMMARAARLLLLALLFAYVVTVVTGFRTTGQSNVPSGMRLLERTRSNDGEYLVVAQRHGSVHWPIFLTLLRRQREQGVDRGQMTSIAAVRWTFERIARTVYVDDNSDGEDQRTKWLAVPYDADPLSHFPEAKPFDDQDGCVLSSGEPAPICVGAVVAKSFVEAGWYRVRAEVTLVTNATAEAQAGMAYANSESPESRSQPAPATTTTTIDLHIRITTRQRSDFLPPVARREIRTLARDEWQRVVEGLHALKFVGVYDLLVAVHAKGMGKVLDPSRPEVNLSHGGPAFLPWHRAYMRICELALQTFAENDRLALPYWDWTIDQRLDAMSSSTKSPIWSNDFLGPNGDFWTKEVPSGPFCSRRSETCDGRWPIPVELDGPALKRELGYRLPILPSADAIRAIMKHRFYDSSPYWNHTRGFRGALEGWSGDGDRHATGSVRTATATSSETMPAPMLGHNSVHQYVGGSMTHPTSPNDPVFLLHHTAIDRIWLAWQMGRDCWAACYPLHAHTLTNRKQAPLATRRPAASGEEWHMDGQHWDDTLWPWSVRVRDVSDADNSARGYVYV